MTPAEGHAMVLLTVHVQLHLFSLNGQSKSGPSSRQLTHLERSRLLCVCVAGFAVVKNHTLRSILHRRQRHSQLNDLLQRVSDGEQDSSTPSDGFGRDDDGEVTEERVGDEGASEAAHVSIWPEAVRREALEASDEGDRRRQRHTDELRQVQLPARAAFCTETDREQITY